MKTVILMRHGKSSWKDRSLDDHDRPLNRRGREAALAMARWLEARGLRPEIVLCSSSRRTCETLELMREAVHEPTESRIHPDLYEAAPATLLGALRRLPERCDTVLLIGHQPELGELLRALTRRVRRADDTRAFEKFPTAAIAVLQTDVTSWHELARGMGELVAFAKPREVAARSAATS